MYTKVSSVGAHHIQGNAKGQFVKNTEQREGSNWLVTQRGYGIRLCCFVSYTKYFGFPHKNIGNYSKF